MKARHWTRVLLMLSACAAIAGAAIFAVSSRQPQTLGWYAYSSDLIFMPGSAGAISNTSIIGLIVCMLGLLGLAFWVGVLVGSRRRI